MSETVVQGNGVVLNEAHKMSLQEKKSLENGLINNEGILFLKHYRLNIYFL